jgi:hypothetical protein
VSHRYIAKSDPYLIVVSTPNKPGNMDAYDIRAARRELYLQTYLVTIHIVREGNVFSSKGIEIARITILLNHKIF